MRPQKPGNSPGLRPEVLQRERKLSKSERRKECARRIFDSANSREIGALQKTVCVAA